MPTGLPVAGSIPTPAMIVGRYYRLITGAYTTSLWRMTFGLAPRIEWDARIKGRGVVGVGEAADLIHQAQLAWMPAAERRRYALTGPPPPQWFTDMQPAPWINGHVISEGRKLAGCPWSASRMSLSHLDRTYMYQRKHAGMSRPMSRPWTPGPDPGRSRWRPGAPASTGPRAPATSPSGAPGPPRGTAPPTSATRRMPRRSSWGSRRPPGTSATASPTASAGHAPGTPSPARARHPTAGPCWTPGALRSWQSKRKIAGNRTPGGPD